MPVGSQRRIKCDEARPACERCVKVGLPCTGYIWAARVAQADREAEDSTIRAYAIPFRVPGSQLERQLLHYFCVEGAADLAGHLPSGFWTQTVLRRSQDDLAVRQAVVAVSCLHRRHRAGAGALPGCFEVLYSGGQVCDEAVVLYNRAIRSLRKRLADAAAAARKEASHGNDSSAPARRPSLTGPLMCCALLCSYEMIQGGTDVALQHLAAGRAMLDMEQQDNGSGGEDAADMAVLAHMIARFEIQAIVFNEPYYAQLVQSHKSRALAHPASWTATPRAASAMSICYDAPLRLVDDDDTSDRLCSLEHAQLRLTQLQRQVLQLLLGAGLEHRVSPTAVRDKQRLQASLERWGLQFADLLIAQDPPHPPPPSCPTGTLPWQTLVDGTFDVAGLAVLARAVAASNPAVGVLFLHYYGFLLFLLSSLPSDPGVWNRPLTSSSLAQPQTPIQLCLDVVEAVVDSSRRTLEDGSNSKNSISVEGGLVPYLFRFVVFCNDLTTIRRTAGILRASSRREGLYDSAIGVAVVDRALTLLEGQHEHLAVHGSSSGSADTIAAANPDLARVLGQCVVGAMGDLVGSMSNTWISTLSPSGVMHRLL